MKAQLEEHLKGIDDQIEDTKEFTEERILDKVVKKRLSHLSLKKSLANYSVEKDTIDNQINAACAIMGA
jgi:hypothetical protein